MDEMLSQVGVRSHRVELDAGVTRHLCAYSRLAVSVRAQDAVVRAQEGPQPGGDAGHGAADDCAAWPLAPVWAWATAGVSAEGWTTTEPVTGCGFTSRLVMGQTRSETLTRRSILAWLAGDVIRTS